ncbi:MULTISPECIES: AAA family ATPase [Colwellia]|uniref:ATP-binding protein n=2 Tax=Colwellia TaxID=28228 RepID=A0ABQ0MZ63_9GAMM|nr:MULTISPECIES: AAA family ATPase [Colwellia]GAW97618.1 ATP-binding protein [Colwellia marinimaniae]
MNSQLEHDGTNSENYDSVYWFLGASYGSTDDQTERFLKDGIWQNGSDDKFLDIIKEIKVGDKVAIKSVYTQIHGLPFENSGKMASVMDIKAIGVVTKNFNDGITLNVDWQTDYQKRTWYNYTYQPRVWQVFPTKWQRKALIDFAFNHAEQDHSKFTKVVTLGDAEEVSNNSVNYYVPLNSILYGPPGTGKTYQSIEAAVKAAEPEKYSSLDIDDAEGATTEQREKLTLLYKKLTGAGRIRFVTFHQSYGYEEFVEGLKANTDKGQISYDVEPGIFKNICDDASKGIEPEQDTFEKALNQFKEELEESTALTLSTLKGHDFSVQYHGNTTFRVFPEATIHDDLGRGYPVSIDNVRNLYHGVTSKKIYNSSYVKSILNHIKSTYNVDEYKAPKLGQAKNFVLIIDEINRGNISKIFGELITLIEPSKRSGLDKQGKENPEALAIYLPHTPDEKFTVPNNLYIIGTMNTADRSLAMMDTALRRRFDFVEMMPKPELFKDKTVKGIHLQSLLRTMNERIEVLYDREHTLGHAFFMPVIETLKSEGEDEAFVELQHVFKNKIIPLLEEYFFEDWNKIRLVLGDNRKTTKLSDVNDELKKTMFVQAQTKKYSSFFGENHGLDAYEDEKTIYQLASFTDEGSPWANEEVYQAIYDLGKLKAIIKKAEDTVKAKAEAERKKLEEANSTSVEEFKTEDELVSQP